ncbi:MAG: Flp pilus assembly protein CpaB [Firmicutes bacterium]|nr:Flp pilus assembly protein CpaB [Bacillota bacterium]
MSTSERVRTFFRVNRGLLLSLIALAVAVYLSATYVRQYLAVHTRSSSSVQHLVPVVVARTTIAAMTPVTPAELTVESWPASDVPPGSFSAVTQLTGSWSLEAVQPGVPVVASDVFQPKSANILAARIAPGDMATDLPLSASDAVDGLIEPGDTVSLFTTITESSGKVVTEDFMNRVKVLAVNGSMVPSSAPTPGQGETLILALPPEQIAALLFAEQKGPITAVLDAPHSTAQPPTPYGLSQWERPTP